MAFYLLLSILGPVVGLLLLISFGPWAFRKLTEFVKSEADAALRDQYWSIIIVWKSEILIKRYMLSSWVLLHWA